MQPDWSLLYLDRIATASEHQARSTAELHGEVKRVAKDLRELRRQRREALIWARRIAILLALYGTGLAFLLLSETKARLVIDLVRAWRGTT